MEELTIAYGSVFLLGINLSAPPPFTPPNDQGATSPHRGPKGAGPPTTGNPHRGPPPALPRDPHPTHREHNGSNYIPDKPYVAVSANELVLNFPVSDAPIGASPLHFPGTPPVPHPQGDARRPRLTFSNPRFHLSSKVVPLFLVPPTCQNSTIARGHAGTPRLPGTIQQPASTCLLVIIQNKDHTLFPIEDSLIRMIPPAIRARSTNPQHALTGPTPKPCIE
ncbi:hypothetical protein BT96DRAFT_1004127 [Gymnopus androsaceus JB14]|uniref:Uncharacterized protein n=1 Tax=Gymnopus androsaceus JB14 TaxID=1447944 RepID=A0A6A4GT49_9AGAR|nr:hypothetical protein BT96DRAFT_1004127 [Gymnopus androsaceus JB14]